MFKRNRNPCCDSLKKDITYELTNSEFGCGCNRDENCQYENNRYSDVQKHIFKILVQEIAPSYLSA